MKIIYCSLGALILVVVAGFRDKTIGTDTTFYAESVFKDALNYPSLLSYIDNTREESGYALLNYLVAGCTDTLQVLLFVTQIITLLFVILAIFEKKLDKYILFIMTMYMFLFFNHTMNFIRQTMAMSCFLYAYACYDNRKFNKAFVAVVFAFFFHKSVIFGLLLVVLSEVLLKVKLKYQFLILLVLSFLVWSLLNNVEFFVQFFSEINLFENYQYYTEENMGTGSNVSEILVRTVLILIVLYVRKRGYIDKRDGNLFVLFLLIEIFFFSLSYISMYLYRPGMYVGILSLLYMPKVLAAVEARFEKIVLYSLTCGLFFFQWYWLWIDHGIGETVPYTSEMLGIY